MRYDDPFTDWLRARLRQIASVRTVQRGAEGADLTLHTWVGMQVQVYLLHAAPTTRVLKRTAQENTRVYRGTLFMAAAALLPPDGASRLQPDEWLTALHAMNGGRVYAFDAAAPGVLPLHLAYLPDNVEREAWYGPPPAFDQLRVLRESVYAPAAARGDYLMADLGADTFYQDYDYRSAQTRRRQANPRPRPTAQYVYGTYEGGSVGAGLQQQQRDVLGESYARLGVLPGATEDEVKRAYRQLARTVHPDLSALDKAEAEAQFRALTEAYDRIRAARGW